MSNEGTVAAIVAVQKKLEEMKDVAVGPDESIWGSQDTEKDDLEILQATFMDDITCSLCCISPMSH